MKCEANNSGTSAEEFIPSFKQLEDSLLCSQNPVTGL